MNQLIQHCKNIHQISAELEIELYEKSIYKSYKTGDYILKENAIANYACFIVKGLVRSFYIKNDEEITTKFLAQNSMITSIYSFYSRKKGLENIVAIEPTELICVHYLDMQFLLNKHIEFNFIVRIITEKYLFFSEIEIFNLRKQTAEERYRYFLKHHSNLLQNIPLKYIASYLNMTMETLSRMRSKIRL